MNAPAEPFTETDNPTYLFATANRSSISWLARALGAEGNLVPVAPEPGALDERIATLAPMAVFLDFSAEQAAIAGPLHQRLKRDWPDVPVLAAGVASEPTAVLAALRAGVDDFVDMQSPPADAMRTLRALLERRNAQTDGTRGCTLAILGARVGLGVTTLATSLALTLQDLRARSQAKPVPGRAPRQGVALLDLGLPPRDGLLYLDTASNFSFIDGVRNLRRLDQTLLHTALAHHSSGVAVLPLPASLAQVREISHAESVALVKRLGDFFDYQVADLGGFSTTDFVAEAARAADHVWIVCDQSIGGIVSTANLVKELHARGIATEKFGLVVNKFDSHVGLSARDISERLQVPLRHVLPMRHAQLLGAASRGELLVRTSRNDPYTQAVAAAARALQQEMHGGGTQPAKDPRWSALMAQLTGGWKKPRES
ncbi:MAG: histidine kinase [Comamonadaceae bacterium]|nr:MAG: histidine kinase [Comamonadaceae bacterium]